MSPEQFAQMMKAIAENGDTEAAHGAADDLMCNLLKRLGYGDGVDVYEKMERWYA